MTSTDEPMITLRSQDEEEFRVPRRIFLESHILTSMTEDSDQSDVVPLMDVSSRVVRVLIEFCEHLADANDRYPEIEKPLRSANLEDIVPTWYADFVNRMEQDLLFETILAANFLDIKPLLDLTCAKVATMLKVSGKTPEDIRRTFNIVNDFSPEEERQVRDENRWIDDQQ